MALLSLPFRLIYLTYFYLVFVLLFLLTAPFSYWFLRSPKTYPQAQRVRARACKLFLFLVGMVPKIEWKEEPDWNRNYLLLSNHTSLLDILVLLAVWPQYHHYMPKIELQKYPVFGMYFRKMDISVDRSSKSASYESFLTAKRQLVEGISIAIYPEGGVPRCAPKLGRFKHGPFRLAEQTKTPILAISFIDNYHHFKYNGWLNAWPGRLRVIVNPAILPEGDGDEEANRLKKKVFDIIESDLKKR